jgi:predicted nucleic acid-binding protein
MISYDTNILIYAIEGHPQFGAAARAIVQQGETDGATVSVLLQHEFLSGVALHNPRDMNTAAALFETFVSTVFEPVSAQICQRAAAMTARYGRKLSGYDALHLATAVLAGSQVFYTNDKLLLELGCSEIAITPLVSQIPPHATDV